MKRREKNSDLIARLNEIREICLPLQKNCLGDYYDRMQGHEQEMLKIMGTEVYDIINCKNNEYDPKKILATKNNNESLERIRQDLCTYCKIRKKGRDADQFLKFLNDKEYASKSMFEQCNKFLIAPYKLRSDIDFILKLVKKHTDGIFAGFNRECFSAIAIELRSNEQFLLSLLEISHVFCFIKEIRACMQTKDFAKKAVELNPFIFACLCDEFKEDIDFLTTLIKQYEKPGDAPPNFTVTSALEQIPRKGLHDDSYYMPLLFPFCGEEIKADRDVVLIILSYHSPKLLENGLEFDFAYFIQYASEKLKNDKEFIKEAIEKNSKVYTHLSDPTKLDQGIALHALKNDGETYQGLPNTLKNNVLFLIKSLDINTNLYHYLPEKLKQIPSNYIKLWQNILARVKKLSPKDAYFFARNNSIRVIKDELFLKLTRGIFSLTPKHHLHNNKVCLVLYEAHVRHQLNKQLDKIAQNPSCVSLYDDLKKFISDQVTLISKIANKKSNMDLLIRYLSKFGNDDLVIPLIKETEGELDTDEEIEEVDDGHSINRDTKQLEAF